MPKSFLVSIGNSVKTFRKQARKTQSTLAKEIGLTTRHFQKIEAGQVDINASTALLSARATEVDPCFLFRTQSMKALESCGISCLVEVLNLLPICIHIFDVHGQITYMNEPQLNFIGLPDWKRSDRPLYIWDLVADPEEARALKTHFETLLRNQSEPLPYQTKLKTKNGASMPVQIQWVYVHDSENRVTGFVATFSPNENRNSVLTGPAKQPRLSQSTKSFS